jgi:hypothetical protein
MFFGRPKREKVHAGPQLIHCEQCGWSGRKGELVAQEVDVEVEDIIKSGMYTLMLASPPTERVDYRCPACRNLLASDLHYYSSHFNEDSFPE